MSAVGTHVYGEFVGAHHLEAAVLDMLWYWLPSYQYEVARDAGLTVDHLPTIRSWRVSSDMTRMPEDQLPAVILVNNGVLTPPHKHSDGVYLAHWEVQLGIHVAAKGAKVKSIPRALTLARLYSLALRLAMIQQRDREGIMGMVDPVNEQPNTVLDSEDDRTTCLAVNTFSVVTDSWAEWGGPNEPRYPPEGETPPSERPTWPLAVTAEVDVVKLSPDASVQPIEEG